MHKKTTPAKNVIQNAHNNNQPVSSPGRRTVMNTNEIEKQLYFWIKILSMNLMRDFIRKLKKFNLTPTESIIIQKIYYDGGFSSPVSIAQCLNVSRASVSKLIDKLDKKGILIREKVPSDKRTQRIYLSQKGILLAKKMISFQSNEENNIFSFLDTNQKMDLLETMKVASSSFKTKI